MYIEGAVGGNFLLPTAGYYQLSPSHPIPAYQNRRMPTSNNYAAGWAAAVRIGHAFGGNFRKDIELSFLSNAVTSTDFLSTNGVSDFWATDTGARGTFTSLALLANVYVDIKNSSALTPYLGVGGGAAYAGGDYVNSLGAGITAHDWGPAVQAIAGASLRLQDRLSLFADYRFRAIFDIASRKEFSPSVPPPPNCGGPGDCGAVAFGGNANAYNHIVTVGVRADLN